MSDAAVAAPAVAATPKKAAAPKKAKAAAKPKKPADHPKYSEMLKEAIVALKVNWLSRLICISCFIKMYDYC